MRRIVSALLLALMALGAAATASAVEPLSPPNSTQAPLPGANTPTSWPFPISALPAGSAPAFLMPFTWPAPWPTGPVNHYKPRPNPYFIQPGLATPGFPPPVNATALPTFPAMMFFWLPVPPTPHPPSQLPSQLPPQAPASATAIPATTQPAPEPSAVTTVAPAPISTTTPTETAAASPKPEDAQTEPKDTTPAKRVAPVKPAPTPKASVKNSKHAPKRESKRKLCWKDGQLDVCK